MIDVLEGKKTEVRVLDKGFVRLVDCMPRLIQEGQTADSAICQAARVSYGEGTKTIREDRGLIRYLMRNAHSSPTEMAEVKFHVKAPLFVARQTVRHRTFSINECSGRYSKMKAEFYSPDEIRAQSKSNKQGSEDIVDQYSEVRFRAYLDDSNRLHEQYEESVRDGVAKELARIGLPLSMYTEWYWKVDLHNLLHFLKLRMDSHAQWEIQQYAKAIFELIKPIFPLTMEAFEDYRLNNINLTKAELLEVFGKNPGLSKTESKELEAKMDKLKVLLAENSND